MTTFGVSGIDYSGFAENLAAVVTRYKAKFGDHVRVDDVDSLMGREANILTEMATDLEELIEFVVRNLLPSSAADALLDEVLKFQGLTRNVAVYSTVTLSITANTKGCTVIAGSLVEDSGGVQWATDSQVIVAPSATGTVSATCVTPGAIAAEIGTLTTIKTDTYGWASVTNLVAATLGRAVETNPAARTRYARTARGVGLHHPSKIYSTLADLDGVIEVALDINNSHVTYTSGLPPQHIRAIVRGGTDADIGDVLFGATEDGGGSVAAGLGTWGSTSVVVTHAATGQTGTVYFDRSTDVPIYIEVRTAKTANLYPANGDQLIKQAIVDYFAGNLEINDVEQPGFGLGDDVVSTRLYTPCNAVAYHSVREVLISTSAGPTTDTDIAIAINQIAVTDVSKINVVAV